ncbi:MAG: IS21 family transposase [Kofleriaceae bacterium]|nr:MAG: IS21 family transposase [Kofleriaceae bacterium]MBZ0231917.1 IS21 family transposase [Kofleriaceae bacterium]
MIDAALFARIRRLFFAEHWKVGTIATELGVHHETVERAVEVDRFVRTQRQFRPSLLDAYKPFIGEVLDQHPKLRATRIFEMVRTRGYVGGYKPVRLYVRSVRPTARAEAFLKLATLPGEQAQVDWGHFGKIQVGAATRSLSCFVLVLSWSRAMFARFTLDQTLETFLRGHALAFEALGGVPRRILYDNLKSVVVERVGEHIRFHPQILECAGHYHFAPVPCAPYRGNEKGKVERAIQYLRHGFFAARRFGSVDDLNRQLAEWIERIAHARPVPGDPGRRPVGDALVEERGRLLPLPASRFECDHVRPVASGKQPYVRFDRNDYSIPHDRIRQSLTLVASETEVRVTDGVTVLAHHARSYDAGVVVEDSTHLEKLTAAKRRALELRRRDRLRGACPSAAAFLDALAQRGEPIGTHAAQLARLLDDHGAAAVDAALAETLERGAVSAASVAHVLDQRARARKTAPPIPVVLPDDPRVRNLRVTPHALTDYDALSKETDDDEPSAA